MLTSSSPTVSAPPSPSVTFQPPVRAYHASRRTSASSTAHSPRFPVSGASPRRYDVASSSKSLPVPSTSSAGPQSPQTRKRSYVDSGTQYTPPGFPPTYHPSDHDTAATAQHAPLPATSLQGTSQGETSAEPVVTEPPEPTLRVDPAPSAPSQHAQVPQTRRMSTEGSRSVVEQDAVPREASAVLQVPSSPAKRLRPQQPNARVMPYHYELCDVKDLGVLISDMLMELVRINDEQPLRDGTLTRFHSRAPPGISVRDYLSRLIIHATLSPPILLSMVFYVDKLCAMYPAFTISSLTVHRFLITAATVAAKGLSDSFWTNSLYARVGGVSVRELALLELEFLRRLDWRIVPKPEVLVDYYKGLVDRGSGFIIEKEPGPSEAESAASAQNVTTPAAGAPAPPTT